ncbi:phospholipase C/P1 nuclease domain-containing protein [Cantharellus anzutake]|uniref:phospholipase C/P1 nuclease domain-containing protein n=1 Tax=Cantharellus anzutake TaxID=1750568 RepID=UPI001904697E|nr:phospholipase C/P1 nuclease domain-containing protein [Cantharellus anzutake]KAF8329465.1 phospholipase C/P1 nuclease domain-containing protein [Cantharellus anzutake]
MRFSKACALFAPAVASVHSVVGWGVVGHQIVATIAEIFLTANSRSAISTILPPETNGHLAPIAAWADRVKNPSTAPLHFANGVGDWPPSQCSFGTNGWTDPQRNVFVGILNNTLGITEYEGVERDHALRYLVHFVGDLHQPLHIVGRDRGGNGDRVRWNRKITNLHSVWDNSLISNAILSITNYTDPLPSQQIESVLTGAIYDPYVRFIISEGILQWWKDETHHWASCPPTSSFDGLLGPNQSPRDLFNINGDESLEDAVDPQTRFAQKLSSDSFSLPLSPSSSPELPACPLDWAKPIHALNCNLRSPRSSPTTLIWPKFLDIPPHDGPPERVPAGELVELDTPGYAGKVRSSLLVEKLLATAGWRLAAILNELLDPHGSGVDGSAKGLMTEPRVWVRN